MDEQVTTIYDEVLHLFRQLFELGDTIELLKK